MSFKKKELESSLGYTSQIKMEKVLVVVGEEEEERKITWFQSSIKFYSASITVQVRIQIPLSCRGKDASFLS